MADRTGDRPPVATAATDHLTPLEQQQVLALVDAAAATDGHRAVNDAGLLALRRPEPSPDAEPAPDAEPRPVHVLAVAEPSGVLAGYGQVLWEGSEPVAALVVHPAHRRQGVGAELWRALAERSGSPLRIWASGNSPAAQALAARVGLSPVRTLLVLGRPLTGELPPADPPAGITIRTFRVGDEDGWLRVNARAFATHPEQGGMTRVDLEQRMAEQWFDPAGLFLAVRNGEEPGDAALGTDEQIVGFHWTKREPGSTTGEVYVIGVDPAAGIHGLGTPLLGAGLRFLRDGGATDVDLYVESDNVRALALYHRYGFTPVTADVMYAAPLDASG